MPIVIVHMKDGYTEFINLFLIPDWISASPHMQGTSDMRNPL